MLERANKNKETAKADNVSFVESTITDIKLPDNIADCIISNCVVNLVPEADKQLVFNEMARLLKPGGRVALSDILAKKELTQELKSNMALYVGCIAGASTVEAYEGYFKKAGFGGKYRSVLRQQEPVCCLQKLTLFEDVLIVDTNSDLNVYFTAKDDGSSGPCCGPNAKPDLSSSCCGPDSASSGCCAAPSSDTFVDKLKKDWEGIDANEWAGEFSAPNHFLPVSVCLGLFANSFLLLIILGSFKVYAVKS
jgi:hypothetical protein